MNPRRRFIDRFKLLGFTVLSVMLVSAGMAHARTETLRWTHSRSGDVQRWEANVGTSPGSYSQVIQLTNIQVGSGGVFQASIEVADAAVVYIALRAIGTSGQRSPLSNERQRSPAATTPPPPAGGSGTGTVGAGQDVSVDPNAVHREDFGGKPVSVAVDGWVDTGANYSLSVDDSLFMVSDLGGNRVLSTDSSAMDIHSHRTGSGYSWAQMTLTGRLAADSDSASLGVTISSSYPAADTYYRLGRSAGGSFGIVGRPGISCGDPSTDVVPQPGDWYLFRFGVARRSSGNQIRAKVWRQGDPEPSQWQADCFDSQSTAPSAGTFGVWSSGPGQKFWDDLEVTTRGGSTSAPPAPPILLQVVPAQP